VTLRQRPADSGKHPGLYAGTALSPAIESLLQVRPRISLRSHRLAYDAIRALEIFSTQGRGEIRSACNWILFISPGTASRLPRFSAE
jgi:hypothetical protein